MPLGKILGPWGGAGFGRGMLSFHICEVSRERVCISWVMRRLELRHRSHLDDLVSRAWSVFALYC